MNENVTKTKPRTKFIFKVLSVGDFSQPMPDGITVLNRPCVKLDGERKKWGNEYLLFNVAHEDSIRSGEGCFYGVFGVDKNRKKQLRLFEDLHIQVKKPDYYILVLSHKGQQFDKDFDLQKADPKSFSQIFSSAFHLHEEKSEYECQSILVLQHGDKVEINGVLHTFSGKTETLEQ